MGNVNCWAHREIYKDKHSDDNSQLIRNKNMLDDLSSSARATVQNRKEAQKISVFNKKGNRNAQKENDASDLTSELDQSKSDITKSQKIFKKESNLIHLNYTDADLVIYSRDNDDKILWVIKLLSERITVDTKNVGRYTYALIRAFLTMNEWDELLACDTIIEDIQWRNTSLPVAADKLDNVIKSEQIYMLEPDIKMSPWIFFKPNGKLGKDYKSPTNPTINDYLSYLIYCFESSEANGSPWMQFVLIIDFNGLSINLKIWKAVHELNKLHYPDRIKRIHLVNGTLKNTHLISKFKERNMIIHDQYYRTELSKYTDINQLY